MQSKAGIGYYLWLGYASPGAFCKHATLYNKRQYMLFFPPYISIFVQIWMILQLHFGALAVF